MNTTAFVAVVILAGAFLAIFGALYLGAVRAFERGELDQGGVRVLRWAVLGQLLIYVLIALTTLFAVPPGPPG